MKNPKIITTLPSGVMLIESVGKKKETKPESPWRMADDEEKTLRPPVNPFKCAYCPKISKELCAVDFLFMTSDKKDGFSIHNPTCKHGRYVTCKECDSQHNGCPVCKCKCDYT